MRLRKYESSVARQAMQWNPLNGIGRRMRRQTVEKECKNLNKTWSDLKQVAQSRVRCRVGVVDARLGSRKLIRRYIFLQSAVL